MDTVDTASEYEQKERDNQIAAAIASATKFDPGEPGHCMDCGKWSGRLVDYLCVPCRELIERKKKATYGK